MAITLRHDVYPCWKCGSRDQSENHSSVQLECCSYKGADKSLARPTSRCILFDGENISFGASLVIYI